MRRPWLGQPESFIARPSRFIAQLPLFIGHLSLFIGDEESSFARKLLVVVEPLQFIDDQQQLIAQPQRFIDDPRP